jgi:hypothetical protein
LFSISRGCIALFGVVPAFAAGLTVVAAPASASDFDETVPVISAAGDIACGTNVAAYNAGDGTANQCRQKYTAPLLAGSDQVWTLGDHVYAKATLIQLRGPYEATWGQYKAITKPSPGDHDYAKSSGYFSYFGVQPFYSFDPAPGWHAISLNSEIDRSQSSEQVAWLTEDLASTTAQCVVAFWGEPRWTSSKKAPGNATFDPFMQALYAAGADLALTGDSHNYERFAKMDPAGSVDPSGIRQFVVGTGGRSLVGFPSIQPNSEKRIKAFGVIQLALRPDGYDWRFIGEAGAVLDSGSEQCSGPATMPPVTGSS